MTNYTSITSDDGSASKSSLPRMSPHEQGTLGIRNTAGVITEEQRRELRFPHNINTYKQMSYDSVVASAINTIKSYVRNVEWSVEAPENPTAEEVKRAEAIESMMSDMDRPWGEFINDILDGMLTFGYNYNEKVYKARNGEGKPNTKTSSKSKFNDGLMGWAKLATRSQDTLDKFIFSKDNRELIGVRQNLDLIPNSIRGKQDKKIILPVSKLLMFRTDPIGDNPMGRSPLRSAFIAWEFKTSLEEFEAIGFQRDFTGLPVFWMPPEYMSADATEDQKALFNQYQEAINNLQMNEQAGLILPLIYDDDKNKLFDFKLAEVSGGKATNADAAIKRWENKILMAFLADVLKTGQDGSGSFALADSKTNLLAIGVAARLREITDVLNGDLVPQTFKMNGWKADRLPKIIHGDLESVDLEGLSKYIQRLASTGAIEVDRPMSEYLREVANIPPIDTANPIDDKFVAGGESKSGEGMKTAQEGTGKGGGNKQDSSSNNNDNKA